MINDVDFEQFDMALIACQEKLDPSNPITVTTKSTLDELNNAGIVTDGTMPGGLKEYIAAVFKVCDLKPSNESLKEILQKPEVQVTLISAISSAKTVKDSQAIAESTVEDRLKNSQLDPASREALKQAMVKLEQSTIKEEARTVDIQNQSEPESKETENAVSAESTADITPTPFVAYCPRCHWDMQNVYAPETFTAADKEQFLYCLLGETAFEKTFSALDDKLKITFKSLTPSEEKRLFAQLRQDSAQDPVLDINQLSYTQFEYELAIALKSIAPSTTPIKPELSDFGGLNAVSDYCTAINDSYIKTAPRKRLVIEMFHVFQRIYKDLLEEVLSENFYHPAK